MKQSEPNSQGPVVHHQTPQAGNSIPQTRHLLEYSLSFSKFPRETGTSPNNVT